MKRLAVLTSGLAGAILLAPLLLPSSARGQAGKRKIVYRGQVFPNEAAACTALLHDEAPDQRLKSAGAADEYGNVHCEGMTSDGKTGYDMWQNGVQAVSESDAPPVEPTATPEGSPSALPAQGAGATPGSVAAAAASQPPLPVVTYDFNQLPQIAVNIWNAQQAGWPRVLTYDKTPGGTSRKNYLGSKRNSNIRGSGVVTSVVCSADEYPFASTLENRGQVHISNVPRREQNAQGTLMSDFYRTHQKEINSGKPFRFEVRLINLPKPVAAPPGSECAR